MRFNISVKTGEHSDIASSVAWSNENMLYSCSDDKTICKWTADGAPAGKINSIQSFTTAISWYPSSGKQTTEIFALACTDGSFKFVSKSGREEKNVKAHEGAVIFVKWSHDGGALVSGGEDGDVKIWSKSGNFRSNIASTGVAVYDACWGPDDDQVLYTNNNMLMIKTVQASRKNLQWKAHDGVVLKVDWNVANNLIVSGGEDCTYKVWDSFGRQLFTSRPMEHVVTAVAWCPSGECFAVGSFNMLRLCDKTGWTASRERIEAGSVMNVAWTSDGTQLAGACGSGDVLFAQVVDRRFDWKNYEVTLLGPLKLRVQDVANETLEDLEFARDRVVEVGIGFDMLVVATTTQCFVYSLQNLNTPIIFDIRAPPHFIKVCKRHFLTLDQVSGLQVISYEGRVLCSPKFQGLRPDYISKDMVSLSADTVVVVDSADPKNIQILDSTTGRQLGKLQHSCEVTHVNLNQHVLGPQERLLAFCDRNRDMYVSNLMASGQVGGKGQPKIPSLKLHSHVESCIFSDETDVLVGLADGRLHSWYQPGVAFIDRDLLPLTTDSSEAQEYGRGAQILGLSGSRIIIRKIDGGVVFASTNIDVSLLYELSRSNKWEESMRLCRHQKSPHLWACLAALSLSKRQLSIAENALAELNEVAKVEYIQSIKAIPSEEGRNAELALFRRQPDEAERILLQANPPLVYRAIKMNLLLYRWTRALEIAVKNKTHVETVLAYRQRHLEEFNKTENLSKFQQMAGSVNFDFDSVMSMEQEELRNEGRRGGGNPRK